MQAVILRATDEGGIFELADVPTPTVEAGKVLVRVRTAGVNRGELITKRNYRSGPIVINGIEFAGEIEDVGEGVTGWTPGTRVMGQARQTMAEYALVDPRTVMPIPADMDFVRAAAFPNVFVTSHNALVTAGMLAAGETVLVNAASSGIGTAAIQIARVMGAGTIIAVSRTRAKAELALSLGATHAIGADEGPLEEAVAAATDGRGADLIIDSLGAPFLAANLRTLALEGRLISVGRTAGNVADLDLDFLSLRRLKIIGVTFRTRTAEEALACTEACARDLLPHLASGAIHPVVDSQFPLHDIAGAHERLASNEQIGKIIMVMP